MTRFKPGKFIEFKPQFHDFAFSLIGDRGRDPT